MSKFMISDHHYGHKNIILYEDRPFSTVQEMDKFMILQHNKVVDIDDEVYVLGDISFYTKDKTKEIISQMNGKKILIKGNHDLSHSNSWFKDVGFIEVYSHPIILDDFYILSHAPVYLNKHMPYVNIHGHMHSKHMDSSLNYYNVSVECLNYTPVLFSDIQIGFSIVHQLD